MINNIINLGDYNDTTQTKNNNDFNLENNIKIVQANGYKEIKEYENLVKNLIQDIRKLALFQKIMDDVMTDQIEFFLIEELLNAVVKPIFEGVMPPFIQEDSYLSMREDMYKDLVLKYIDNNKMDKPF